MHRTARLIAGGFVAAFAAFDVGLTTPAPSNPPSSSSCRLSSFYSRARSYLRELRFLALVQAETVDEVPKITPWNWNWDGRHQETTATDGCLARGDEPVRKPRCSRHLIFIRHGQYHYADSDAECHLTSLGHEQLNFTGLRLKHLNFPYLTLYYSTMTRAVESTEEVLKHLPDVKVVPSVLLREGAPYPLEPPLPFYRPTAKELREDGERIESAFKTFIHRPDASQTQDSYEIFVCHGNVIRYIVCRALQLPPEAWIRFSLDHGSITWLVIRSDGRVALKCLGDSGHIPPDRISVQ